VNFSQTGTSSNSSLQTKKIPYEVINERCTEENNCFVLALVDSQYFNKKNMNELANQFSKDFKDKNTVTISIFDDKKLVNSYAEGKKEIRELSFDARGRYQRFVNKEYLIFSSKKKLGDLSNSEVIRIQN
jgi:hypothetical protein